MSIRVVLEHKIQPHDPGLYVAEDVAPVVASYDAVDDAELAAYDDRGFMIVRGAYGSSEVEAARRELKAMTVADDPRCEGIYFEGAISDALPPVPAKGRPAGESSEMSPGPTVDRLPPLPPDVRSRYVRKFMGFSDERHPPLHRLATKPEMVALIERLVRQHVRMSQDMAMIKPPGGREKPWHQDHAYFNLPLDTRIVGLWIALDEVTPANGCMYLLAGGHREGPKVHFKRRDWQICDDQVAGRRRLAAPMRAGDALLFDAKLPHGTPTNRTDQTRWAVQLHFVPRSVTETDDDARLAVFGSEGKNVTC
jgi:phytanoyl-CoA hydroxylase